MSSNIVKHEIKLAIHIFSLESTGPVLGAIRELLLEIQLLAIDNNESLYGIIEKTLLRTFAL